MRRLFGCPDFVSLTNKIINGYRNIFWIFTENKPVRGLRKKYNIPDLNWLKSHFDGTKTYKHVDILSAKDTHTHEADMDIMSARDCIAIQGVA